MVNRNSRKMRIPLLIATVASTRLGNADSGAGGVFNEKVDAVSFVMKIVSSGEFIMGRDSAGTHLFGEGEGDPLLQHSQRVVAVESFFEAETETTAAINLSGLRDT